MPWPPLNLTKPPIGLALLTDGATQFSLHRNDLHIRFSDLSLSTVLPCVRILSDVSCPSVRIHVAHADMTSLFTDSSTPSSLPHLAIGTAFDITCPQKLLVTREEAHSYSANPDRGQNSNDDIIDTGTHAVCLQVSGVFGRLFASLIALRIGIRCLEAASFRANDAVMTLLLHESEKRRGSTSLPYRQTIRNMPDSPDDTDFTNDPTVVETIIHALTSRVRAMRTLNSSANINDARSMNAMAAMASAASCSHSHFEQAGGSAAYRPFGRLFEMSVSGVKAVATIQADESHLMGASLFEKDCSMDECLHPCVNFVDASFLLSLPHGRVLVANAADAHPLTTVVLFTPQAGVKSDVPVRLAVLGTVALDVAPLKCQRMNCGTDGCGPSHKTQNAEQDGGKSHSVLQNDVIVMSKSAWICASVVDNLPVPIHLTQQYSHLATCFEESEIPFFDQNVPKRYRNHPFWQRLSALSSK